MESHSSPLPVKVMSGNREKRKGIVSYDYEDLVKKCRQRFNVDNNVHIKLVIEEDGFEIDKDFYPSLHPMAQLMLLVGEESWDKPSGGKVPTAGQTDGAKPSLVDLVNKIRNKQTSLFQQKVKKRPKVHMKLKIGWLFWICGKYVQVRQKTAGGVYNIDISSEARNEEILQKAKELFFPNGINSCKGAWTEFQHVIGDYKHNIFSNGVSLSEFFQMYPSSQNTPRLYLMTKKLQEEELELPDIEDVLNEEPDIDVISSIFKDENEWNSLTEPRPGSSKEPTPGSSKEPTPGPSTEPISGSSTEPIPGPTVEVSTVPIQPFQSEVTDDNFEAAGTPTVQFRSESRRSLSLHRPNYRRPQCRPTADIIEVIDSEDEEIALAVEASLGSAESSSDSPPEPANLKNVLEKFQEKAISEGTRSTVIVSRANVLKSAFAAMSRPGFSPRGNLYIKFSGEIGEDYGGPRREFFRLAMQELQASNIFEGPEDNRYFSHDVELLQKKQYFLAGQLVALSIAHDGPSFSSLNEHLFDFMVGSDSLMFDCAGILPVDIQNIITELRAISTEPEKERFLVNHGDWLIDQGLVNIFKMTLTSKEDYARLIQKQYICFRTSAEISQFVHGIETLDVWNIIKENKEVFKPLFCIRPSKIASKMEFDTLYRFVRSEEGSNLYRAEESTIYGWEIFLQDIEDKAVPVTFDELMTFITGADMVPVLGFSKKIEVMFFNQEPGLCRLPYASTCALQIWLPRETDALSDILVRALKESHGFHKI